MKTVLYNRNELTQRRKQLRNNSTPAEAILWRFLKKNQIEGRKFRRQASISKYIVDFYCPREKLAIELDGQVHQNDVAYEYDKARERHLNEIGITALRFENKMIFENISGVLSNITKHLTTPVRRNVGRPLLGKEGNISNNEIK